MTMFEIQELAGKLKIVTVNDKEYYAVHDDVLNKLEHAVPKTRALEGWLRKVNLGEAVTVNYGTGAAISEQELSIDEKGVLNYLLTTLDYVKKNFETIMEDKVFAEMIRSS